MEKNNYISIRIEENKIGPIIKEENNTTRIIEDFDFNFGSLNLEDFPKLKSLHLFKSQVIKIKISENNQLEGIVIVNNDELEVLDLKNLNTEKIIRIVIMNNPKLKFDLKDFSKFINLKTLQITNSNCVGSLFSLRKLINLEILRIYNTQITPSYEYLNNETIISFPIDKDLIEKDNLNNKFLMNINKKIHGDDFKFSLEIEKFKEVFKKENPQLLKNAEIIIEYYSIYESWKETLFYLNQVISALSFLNKKRIKDSNYNTLIFEKISSSLNKNELLIDAIFNQNQSFHFWLEEKLRTIDELRSENEDFCKKMLLFER